MGPLSHFYSSESGGLRTLRPFWKREGNELAEAADRGEGVYDGQTITNIVIAGMGQTCMVIFA